MTKPFPSPFDGFRLLGRRGGGAALSPAQKLEAWLDGVNGFYLDTMDPAVMFQDTAEAVPVVSAANPMRRINTKYGTSARNWQAPTDAARPPWNGSGGITFDAADDYIDQAASYATFGNPTNVATIAFGALTPTIVAGQRIFGVATANAGDAKITLQINAGGSLSLFTRRLVGDTINTFTSAAGVVTAGANHDYAIRLDYLTTGSVEVFVDGVSRISGTMTGSPGASTTTEVRFRIGSGNSGNLWGGTLKRFIAAPKWATNADLAFMRDLIQEAF